MHISIKKSSKRAELEKENEKLREQVASLTKKIDTLKLQHKNELNALQEQHERETTVLLRAMHRGEPPPSLPLSALVEAELCAAQKKGDDDVDVSSPSIDDVKTGCESSETVSDSEDLSDSGSLITSFEAFCSSVTSPKEGGEESVKESNETEKEQDDRKDAVDAQLGKRWKVMEELVATENSYCNNLELLVTLFVRPLREQGVLNTEDIDAIFGNVEDIFKLSQTFRQKLNERAQLWTKVNVREQFLGDLLLQVFPFMRIYARYCHNCNKANMARVKLQKDTAFNNFLKVAEKRSECNKQDLPSFLIQPVQRVPRYVLLVKEVVKFTSNYHADYADLCKAINIIEEAARFINKGGKGDSKLLGIQKAFGNRENLIQPWRVWIRDGTLKAVYKKAEMQVWLYLFTDILCYAKSPNNYLGKIQLAETWVMDLPDSEGGQNLFQLFNPQVSFTLAASNETEKYEWIKALGTAIDSHLQRCPKDKQRRKMILGQISFKESQNFWRQAKSWDASGGSSGDEGEGGDEKEFVFGEDHTGAFLNMNMGAIGKNFLEEPKKKERRRRRTLRHSNYELLN